MDSLQTLVAIIKTKPDKVKDWFHNQWKNLIPLPYFSCDIRHSEHKIGIVDTNVFPGGFNNLCNAFTRDTISAIKNYFSDFLCQLNI